MATTAQIQKLRRKIQDFYNKRTREQLSSDEQAFHDEELEDIIDDASAEVSDGASNAESLSALHESWMILLARADAILQIAQDEARRIKWQMNNDVVDPSNVAINLVRIAETLQKRYKDARDRQLKENVEGVTNRPTGNLMNFNSTVRSNSERNFNNATVNRNRSPDHY